MKNSFLVLVLTVLFLSSCKKEYTCWCYMNIPDQTGGSREVKGFHDTIKSRRPKMEKYCEDLAETFSNDPLYDSVACYAHKID